jgi:hypothetical protein
MSCLQKLALTSPTSGDRSVGIVRSRTQAMGMDEGVSRLHHMVLLCFSLICGA